MVDKSKRIILITIILLIIVIIGVLILIKKTNKNLMYDRIEYDVINVQETDLKKVSFREEYYVVKRIVEKYYYSLCNSNKTADDNLIFEYDEEIEKLDEEIAKYIKNNKNKIYNYFDESYIEETKLSTDNLKEKLGNYNDLYVLIKDMYVRDISGYLRVYFVFGTVIEKETFEKEEFELMIVTDEKNRTFNIYTSDYINQNNLYELSKNKDFNMNITEIENRKYNTYKYEYVSDETYVSDLLSHYKQSIKYTGADYSYNKLDEEYREKRFNEKSDYEEYVEDNKQEITTAVPEYYKYNKYNGYKQYICIDSQGNYYIFNETSVMNYTLMLDTYTIGLPGFIEEYQVATTEEKVALNIQKIVEALNAQDYKYVYNKLADEFKANYFKTYEDFEKYAQNTFDIRNEVTYNKYTETKDLSTYQITLKGKNKKITKTIVMKLEEGTNFVMSFNVE